MLIQPVIKMEQNSNRSFVFMISNFKWLISYTYRIEIKYCMQVIPKKNQSQKNLIGVMFKF